ncbi:MAG: glycoside-pentoside-hexuronide (GPH):cation symporter, partial [Spirochaetota bacterium]
MAAKLTSGFKLRFSLAELGFSTLRAAMDFFLLYYYTDIAGINPAIAASALLVGKLTWDAINDPLFGHWSDRTRSRFGRRRIWMLLAALPIAVFSWLQFSLPQGLSGVAAFFAVLLTFWLKDTFVTMAVVPYYSLMPEVTRDYRERSSIAMYRGAASVVGYLIGAAGMTALVGAFGGAGLSVSFSWSVTAGLYGLVAALTLIITTLSTKEQANLSAPAKVSKPFTGIRACFRNRPFVILAIVFVLGNLAFTTQATLLPYLLRYQLGMAGNISLVLMISLATTGVFLLLAKFLADRVNKGPAYALGLGLAAITFLLAFAFLPHHQTPWIYVVAVVLGIAFSAQWVLPYAMMPDIIEWDERMTGERREGIYYGIVNFLIKFAVALGVAVPGWVLAWSGYVPNVEQTETALLAIRFTYAVVPA